MMNFRNDIQFLRTFRLKFSINANIEYILK